MNATKLGTKNKFYTVVDHYVTSYGFIIMIHA